ncbi:heavy metal translocating P-type ATPase [Salinibacter ruber]|nr:heavy metal translocating P-type ATPase [Salinibacter ruber]MCS3659762.1 heavy metal translocating P-type ATPase [Salinibacter ruber]MCS3706883.1 heavy metal translocating P-type ATPase [Salinibacter ruber]MCS4190585.1 heavy metal translocating P-type ATPase [Salinibacter ruber]
MPISGTEDTAVSGVAGRTHYCCYGCRMRAETLGDDEEATRSDEQQTLLVRLFAGVLMAGFVMVFSLAISSGYGFGALQRLEHEVGTAHWVLLLAAVPALLLLGPPLLRSAWDDLRGGGLTLNVLFTLGTTSAVVVSGVSYARGTGPIYLETAVMLLALYTLGRYLTARAKDTTTHVLRRLLQVPDTTYVRLGPDAGEVVPDDLRVDDRIRVPAGDVIPVDGTVVEGRSYVDESSLTGESQPVVKEAGDTVYAGTTAQDGALTIDATAVAEDRRLARVAQMMHRALEQPPRLARLTDRILRWLIPGVVGLALVAFAGWWGAVGFSKALYVALSVVLITCPCALGIAIPLSLTVAVEQAGRKGVLVRSGRTLLDLARATAVTFDKTGTLSTLTAPSVRVLRPETVPVEEAPAPADDAVLRRAAAVEQGTNHALATAVVEAAADRDLSLPAVADVTTHPGAGVVGRVQVDGRMRRVGVGNERLLDALGVTGPPRLHEAFADEADAGRTPLYVVDETAVVGLLSIEERVAPHAEAVVGAVRERSEAVSVLTGDRPAAARRLEDRLGVRAEAGLAPDEKVDRLAALRDAHGPVVMVGDGINDAAALAEADVGIALSSGASVSMEAADVTLYNPDLRLVPWLQHLGCRTHRVIQQNLWWTFGYNAIGLGLAVAGLLHPIAAVVIMTLSSILVTGNAFRLRRIASPEALP